FFSGTARGGTYREPARHALRGIHGRIHGRKNTCPDGIAGYLAPVGLHLYDTLRVRKRATIRGLGPWGLGRHGRNGLPEQRAYRRNRGHGTVRLHAGGLRGGSAGTVVRRARLPR